MANIDKLINELIEHASLVVAINVDSNHHEIHEGEHFFLADYITLGNGATGEFVFETTSKELHFVFGVNSDIAGFTMELYEDITANADGTEVEAFNNNRNSSNVTSAVIRYNPTGISIVGKKRLRRQKVGSGGSVSTRVAGNINRSDEIVFYPGKKYLIKITNLSTSNNDINHYMTWYEV